MKLNKILAIPETYKNLRIDAALAQLMPEYSRSRIKEWINSGAITANNQPIKPKDKVIGNEIITISATIETVNQASPEAIELNITYEDDDIIVINKPAGMVVHPGAGNTEHTMLNALLHHCDSLKKLPRAGIIHRIDKNTTGLLVIAKNIAAHTFLVRALQNHEIHRQYKAIVYGELTGGGTINAPIGRHPTHRTKMAVVNSGRPSITHYKLIKRLKRFTFIDVILETGRTHQIRVHMAHKGYPLVGDPLYSGRLKIPKGANEKTLEVLRAFKRQALHAYKLTLIHPLQHKEMSFVAPIPDDMNTLLHYIALIE
jgi:23S rRNA pseudouridine1911/1915/1917 synthase